MRYLIVILFGVFLIPSCAIFSKKKSPEYYYQQGVLEHKETNSYRAISDFSRAIKLKTNYYDAYYERASTYMSIDSINKAVEDYDSLLSIKTITQTDRGKIYFLKGHALYLGSSDSLACKCWKLSRELNYYPAWDKVRLFCK